MKIKLLILVLTIDPRSTGTFRHIYELIIGLAKFNYEISVLTVETNETWSPNILLPNVRIIRLKRCNIFPFLDILNVVRKSIELKYLYDYDIIFAHIVLKLLIPAFILKRIFGKKLVVWHAGTGKGLKPKITDSISLFIEKRIVSLPLFRSFDILITGGKELKREYIKAFNLNPSRVNIIWNFVNTKKFQPRKKNRSSSDKIQICYIGRLNEQKGTDILIRELKLLNDNSEIISWECDIIGGNPGSIAKYKRITNDQIADRSKIKFLGSIPNIDLQNILPRYDIFILPSRTEGSPRALIEAMACGVVCIATNKGSIPMILDNGRSGIIVDVMEIGSIYNSIKYLINNPRELEKYSLAARNRVEKKFCLERAIKSYNLVLKQIF